MDYDSYSDALFLNTPNPNESVFPFKMSELTAQSNFTNKDLDNYIKNLSGYTIWYGKAEENFCVIYKEGIGQPPK